MGKNCFCRKSNWAENVQDTESKAYNNNNWDIISSSYSYNEIFGGLQVAINPDTVTYGAVGTEDETFAIKSRVIEGYTYTL